ncbi:phage holin family protein [Lysinibacillus macroides]|uniref:Holin n=1 Tax=Lysinibacillus macroides TaxID=33935 RepID=A0A0M9DG59_9BACI|nr:phage holin family protein [Lysinibacillus macroides]KOY80179.1 hypothetical protein ADM90_23530 [Lysinibacillus macroides]QPR67470.1 phage holin family protein [Lysinibacillus macroides]
MNLVKEYSQLLVAHPAVGAVGTVAMMTVNFMFGTGITLTAGLVFLAVLALDWVSGRAASKKDGTMASEYGINGAYRSAFMVGILVLAYRVDIALGLPYIVYAYFLFNFGSPTWKSMTANVYRAGWERWIPGFVLERVADEIEHKTARANKRLVEKNKYLEGETK